MQISSFVNNQDPLILTGLLKKQLRTPLGLEKSSRKSCGSRFNCSATPAQIRSSGWMESSDVSCVPTTTTEDGYYRWMSALNLGRYSIVRLTGLGLNVELPVLVA